MSIFSLFVVPGVCIKHGGCYERQSYEDGLPGPNSVRNGHKEG
jgi:hypothetical protein